ncbi:hypothetical protein [Psychromonas sp.]|uniref:hypothetical protein n=1 Tax=Psychromonas sp. TaxID=1884585 RepID=UPI0035621969
MSSETIAVSYQDLASKGLIGDLKQAAFCDVKTVCRIPCDRCPNVLRFIDSARISLLGIEVKRIVIKQSETGELDLHITADNIIPWLKKNNITPRKIPGG